jgi:hypothetical protein
MSAVRLISLPLLSPAEGLPVCPAFAEVGNRYGPFDVALIPIGAYGPRSFMSSVHCSPGMPRKEPRLNPYPLRTVKKGGF